MRNDFDKLVLLDIASKERRSIISGPFGSNISSKYFVLEGIPVIRGNNLSINSIIKFIDDGFVFVSKEKAEELNTYAVKDDIIFTAVGTIGQVGIIREDSKFEKYIISNKQMRIRLNTNMVNPYYVYYWLTSSWILKSLLNNNTGSAVPLLNLGILKRVPIYLPKNRTYQDKVVSILLTLDKKIELNNQINQNLEAMAKTLYDYWFVQFDFPNANGKPYKSSGGKMVYSEELKREIPEGWEVKELGEIASIIAGGDKPKNFSKEQTDICKIPIFSNGIQNEGLYGFTDKARITKQSITISARGTIGYSVLRNEPYVPIIRLISVTPNLEYTAVFLYHSIENLVFENSGSVQHQLTVPQISTLTIVMPENLILEKFGEITFPIMEKLENIKKETQKLTQLRDWLLPMLMNGQLTVGRGILTPTV